MNATKFRIPDTGLYLRADGTLSPTVEPGETALDLTSEHAELLEVVYHGQALKQMTLLSNSGFKGSGQGDIFDIVAVEANSVLTHFTGVDFFGFAKKLNDWMTGAHGEPDPIMAALGQLQQRLIQIQDFALAAWVSSRQDNLAYLMAHSTTAIQTANAFLQSGASRNDPVWAGKIANADTLSLMAVNTFSNTQSGYWLRPESLAAISWAGDPTSYYHGWMPHMPDRAEVNHFKQVWDYRWGQSALIYVIVARLIVLKSFETGSAPERVLYCQEIEGYYKLLGTVFSKRWSGIRKLDRLSDLQLQQFRITGRIPMAAVDIYGGDFLGGIFFMSNFRPGFFAPGIAAPYMREYGTGPLNEEWVENNMREFARHWWNVLYRRTGLEELLLVISELQVICAAPSPWFSRAYIDVRDSVSLSMSDKSRSKAAYAAVALSDLIPAGDEAENAARTHFLYEALCTGGDQAQKIVANCVRDLSYLAEAGAPTGKKEQPIPVTTSAEKRRKRKDAQHSPSYVRAVSDKLITEPPENLDSP
jgi:hypothetical protein